MAAAPLVDRLSDLSDDVQTHILSFLSTREAVRTTALSRRWRNPLWLHTGAVHIDYRSYNTAGGGFPDRRRLLDDAEHAYACVGRIPEKVSIVMPNDAILCECDAGSTSDKQDQVEDLAVITFLPRCTPPFAAIRLLQLTGYGLKPYSYSDPTRQLAFPRLEAMHLHGCRTELATLQAIITAAPRLADLRLESLSFLDYQEVYRLSCEATTSIVMANCGVLHHNLHFGDCKVQLDAPRLPRFRYAQVMAFEYSTFLTFGSPTPHIEHVHVEVHSAVWETAYPRRSILADFADVRSLKLTAYSIADLDIGLQMVSAFHNLERLEIEELCGWSVVNHRASAEAVENLLICMCPSLVELRVKFSWRKYLREINPDPAVEMAAIADFCLCRSIDNIADKTDCCHALEVGLHGRLYYGSIVSGLRRVMVEFDADELTCFQVRLIKFLANNAMDLQEFFVDGGKRYDSSRIDEKVARWMEPWRPHDVPGHDGRALVGGHAGCGN